MPPLRIGILGAARIAPGAVINPIKENADLAEKCVIAAVAARSLAKAAAFAVEHGIEGTFDSYEAMLADDSIDAVYNPLPNSRHAELTIMALQAGKQCAIQPYRNTPLTPHALPEPRSWQRQQLQLTGRPPANCCLLSQRPLRKALHQQRS